MRQPDDGALIADIIRAGEEAVQFTAGLDYEDYAINYMLQLALVKLIEIIGEAARKLSTDAALSVPNVKWHEITGMRNRLVHDYNNIDLIVLWRSATEDVPALLEELRPLLPPAPTP